MKKIAIKGNHGEDVRSDCMVKFTLSGSGGIKIEINSKVESLFGKKISGLADEMLNFYSVKNGVLKVDDTGALDYVLSARIEAAICELIESEKEYLPSLYEIQPVKSDRDRFRFTRLYLPGNTPKFMLNAGIYKSDGIILDLEDSVAPDKKYEARFLVRNALRQIDFMGAERMVRINQLPAGLTDLEFVVPHFVDLILIPKVENADQIEKVDNKVSSILKSIDHDWEIFLMPIIESALGVENAFNIARSSERIVAMAIGLEDYTADLGVIRTNEGKESLYARTRIVNACRAARIQPIDSVFSDVADLEGLRENVMISRALGFEGMGCIHPRQIQVIHDAFMPSDKEIAHAVDIVLAYEDASSKGLGVIALGTKMIDPPVVKQAFRIIALAEKSGILNENWRSEHARD